MREKFLNSGREAFTDHELLEMLLYNAIPRRNTNEIAHRLIDKFGSFSNVLDADIKDIMDCGLSKNTAVYLHLVKEAGKCYFTEGDKKPRFITIGDAAKYITKLMYKEKHEQLYIFLLDIRMRLVGQKKLSEGNIDSVSIDTRVLLKTVLSYNAAYAIIAHNHPTGSARPTRSDVELTRTIVNALNSVGVKLCDHLIVSGDDFYSFNQGMGIEDGDDNRTLRAHQYADISK